MMSKQKQIVLCLIAAAVLVVLPLFAHPHEAVLAQHLQMLRHGRLGHAELVHEVADRELAATLPQLSEDLSAGAVGEVISATSSVS